jgi:small-conductance mechanosensitive channel/CRP-like cAMP-binding protein
MAGVKMAAVMAVLDWRTAGDVGAVPIIALAVYLALLAVGRWVKQRVGVRWGAIYQLFSGALAAYVALTVAMPEVWWRGTIGAVTVFLCAALAVSLTQRMLWELHFEQRRKIVVPRVVRDVVALIILGVAVLLILSVGYHVRIPGLLAGSGIVALAVGLAAQDLLGNVIAGCVLHFEKPFKVGDWLLFEGRHVEVMEMSWRSTRVRTNDDLWLDVPNSQISKQTIANLYYPVRKHAMRLELGIDCNELPNRVKDVLAHAAATVEHVLPEPPPQVYLKHFGEFANIYEIRYWMEDHTPYNEVEDAVRTNIWYALQRHRIKIPYPTRTLHMETLSAPAEPHLDGARDALRQNPLFRSLDDAPLQTLLAGVRVHRFGRGEKLIEQGRDGDSMFILLSGTAEVSASHNGGCTHLATLNAGACIGEMSLLTGEMRSATVTVTVDCEIVELNRAKLAELFRQHPQVLQQVSELLAQRKLENEGLLAAQVRTAAVAEKQRQYTAGFVSQLQGLFRL